MSRRLSIGPFEQVKLSSNKKQNPKTNFVSHFMVLRQFNVGQIGNAINETRHCVVQMSQNII
jgi:hypothetical protein